MAVNRGNLKTVVEHAWNAARKDMSGDHRERSTAWVDALAKQFDQNYELEKRHRVLWKGNCRNKKNFGLNELLFDIVVCSVSTTESLQRQSKPP